MHLIYKCLSEIIDMEQICLYVHKDHENDIVIIIHLADHCLTNYISVQAKIHCRQLGGRGFLHETSACQRG